MDGHVNFIMEPNSSTEEPNLTHNQQIPSRDIFFRYFSLPEKDFIKKQNCKSFIVVTAL